MCARGSGDALEMGLWEGAGLTPTGNAAEDLGVGLYFIHPHLWEIRINALAPLVPPVLLGNWEEGVK